MDLLYDSCLINNRGGKPYEIISSTSRDGIYLMHSAKPKNGTRKLLFNSENGKCFWCKTQTKWSKKVVHPDVPTVDHLYSKRDPRRYIEANNRLCVLACYNCNTARARLEEEMMESTKLLNRQLWSLA